jgi:hypothetical protein
VVAVLREGAVFVRYRTSLGAPSPSKKTSVAASASRREQTLLQAKTVSPANNAVRPVVSVSQHACQRPSCGCGLSVMLAVLGLNMHVLPVVDQAVRGLIMCEHHKSVTRLLYLY